MFTIQKVDLNNEKEVVLLSDFLQRFSLQLDLVDQSYVIIENDCIIATCSLYKNVLKCFAIDDKYQNMGITNQLISYMLKVCFDLNIQDIFIFTKVVNAKIFKGLNFEEIYFNKSISLLHYGPTTINKVLSDIPKYDGLIGAIVMNANPFTLGHQYLVEYASQQVDHLYVFVVQEDVSYFSFEDRYMLVLQGCSKYKNVTVLPSSIYMISSATFPTYFLKDEQIVVSEHARMDATIFAQYFAKTLSIKKRFVGQEPLDVTTDMYNQVMKDVLTRYDIQLIVIPRKEMDDQVISASIVRKYLNEGKLDKIQPLVPDTTYQLILEKYAK